MRRAELLSELAHHIASIRCPHPTRVAIDGVDASGKTTLADELVAPLQAYGRHIIRASIDGFHQPRNVRYQRGADSPEGYYLDSFDYVAIKEALLQPLGPTGSLQYCTATFDFRHDLALSMPVAQACSDSILLFDGVFLLRPELSGLWDFTVFVHADFAVALSRVGQRDETLFGSAQRVQERYRVRYIPAQCLYLANCRPQDRADVVVVNNDPVHPELRFRNASQQQ